MFATLLRKSFRESLLLLVGVAVVAFGFQWIFIWTIKQLPMENLEGMMALVPKHFFKFLAIPIDQILTLRGRIGMGYTEPVIIIVISVWSIGRASDAVSGELGRGTLEMILAQPASRFAVLAANAVTTTLGSAAIALASWLGMIVGLAVFDLGNEPPARWYLASAGNVFAFGFFLAGVTTAISAADRYRWRTLGIAGAFFVIEKIIEVIGQGVEEMGWMKYLTFFSLFKPPLFVTDSNGTELFWQYNAALVGLGLIGYIAAAIIFERRDLPAAL
jgi:ABC-2 type transport system permease protein